jgi:uncharacterized protein YcaQ
MYTKHLADIRRENYDAIRDLPTRDLPRTFDEWASQRDQEAAEILGGGNHVGRVEVKADRFADFCRKTNRPYDRNSLADFVWAMRPGS